MRPDFMSALGSWRYLFKLATAGSIALVGLVLLLQLARPEQSTRRALLWLLPLALAPLLISVALEFMMLPTEQWRASAMGFIPSIACAWYRSCRWGHWWPGSPAKRRRAPQSPAVAGAVIGFAAGGIGATDLVRSIATTIRRSMWRSWYLGAVVIVTLLGAILGRSLLRW